MTDLAGAEQGASSGPDAGAPGRAASRGRGGGREAERFGAADVIAGLTVALVLIPQSLAYATVAGLPPHFGLYAAAAPAIAAAFFASSPYLQTGPTAITALLVAGALAVLAPAGSAEYVRLAALLALIVGAVRVVIGLLHAGKLIYLMSEPVLRGFTLGAALLIISSQLPGTVGLAPEPPGLLAAFSVLGAMRAWHPDAVLVTGATVLLVLGARRVHPLLPGVLLATIAGIVISVFLGYGAATVGSVPPGLPPIALDLPWGRTHTLFLSGIVIAVVGFAEAGAIARMYAARERRRWDPDQEFVGQGVANLAAAVTAGFPVGGSFSRSSLARIAGARTRWTGAVTGGAVLLFLPFANLIEPLPVAVLSTVVIIAVTGLVRVRPVLDLWRVSRSQFLVALITLILTVLLAPHVEQAVLLGIILAVIVHLWSELQVDVESWTEGDVLYLRPRGVLWFGSADALRTEVEDLIARHPEARCVELRMGRLGRVDLTGALVLEQLVQDTRAAGLEVRMLNIHPRTARALSRVLEEPLEAVPSRLAGALRYRTEPLPPQRQEPEKPDSRP
jgi:sulfate permease, SulP family